MSCPLTLCPITPLHRSTSQASGPLTTLSQAQSMGFLSSTSPCPSVCRGWEFRLYRRHSAFRLLSSHLWFGLGRVDPLPLFPSGGVDSVFPLPFISQLHVQPAFCQARLSGHGVFSVSRHLPFGSAAAGCFVSPFNVICRSAPPWPDVSFLPPSQCVSTKSSHLCFGRAGLAFLPSPQGANTESTRSRPRAGHARCLQFGPAASIGSHAT